MRRSIWPGLAALLLTFGVAASARGASCTPDDFAAAVDKSGAALRAFNAEALPKLKDKLRELKERKGWDEAGFEEKGLNSIRDAQTAKLDAAAEDLIVKIDKLGRPPADKPPDCAMLSELEAAGLELLAVMRAKSTYTLERLDAAIAAEPGAAPAKSASAAEPKAATPPQAKTGPKAEPKPDPKVARAAPEAPPPSPSPKSAVPGWDTETEAAPPVLPAPLPLAPAEQERGYSIGEIQEITRGFFGTISTSLASVLEYAFASAGRPDGYVLGKEGGGAFLAGVRYGSGTLYMRAGGTQKVYWHGPSIGTDFGAAGSRTMFLIYNLKEPADLMRGFTGIDGSAYFVGGIGITFLKGGDVIMAPIRSGLGLRIGANVGYIRFTPRATWNPF